MPPRKGQRNEERTQTEEAQRKVQQLCLKKKRKGESIRETRAKEISFDSLKNARSCGAVK